MAQGNQPEHIDIGHLTILLRENGLPTNPPHGTEYAVRMTEGWWGDYARFTVIRVAFQDNQGNPLPRPEWEYINRDVRPLNDSIIGCTFRQAQQAFNNIDLARTPSRYGPLSNGLFLITDPEWLTFNPLSAVEIADLDDQEIRDFLAHATIVLDNVMADVVIQQREIEDLTKTNLRLRNALASSGTYQPIGMPIAQSSPAGPSASVAGPHMPAMPSVPYISAIPSAPPAPIPVAPAAAPPLGPLPSAPAPPVLPVIQPNTFGTDGNGYTAVGPVPVLPIAQIKAVIGEAPTDARQIPLWVAKHAAAIEGTFPTGSADVRCRVLNALLTSHGGMTLSPNECGTWSLAAAALYQRIYGVIPLHDLPHTMAEVARREGILVAFNMGMTFTNNSFDVVWGIIRPLLPGQASVAMLQGYLDQYQGQQQKAQAFPTLLRRTFETLGLNYLGQSIRSNQPARTSGSVAGSITQGRGRGQPRSRPPNRASNRSNNPPRPPPPRSQEQQPSPAGRGSSSSSAPPQRSGYNLRQQINRPQRLGGGPNPYRNLENRNIPRSETVPSSRRAETSETNRPNQARGGQQGSSNRNQTRSINTVRASDSQVIPSAPPAETNPAATAVTPNGPNQHSGRN
ncbi:Gag [Spider monkey simian foamy virus]|uniref:Gag polyprotein n=1 Tax=Spider monkey simian foamy virus TaxID=2170200 RepID=A8HC77_9RETR|nr:Gag [Spider monkey simian foamy virus]ABV59398.1 Gag [Spider monkey simian foamy virus]